MGGWRAYPSDGAGAITSSSSSFSSSSTKTAGLGFHGRVEEDVGIALGWVGGWVGGWLSWWSLYVCAGKVERRRRRLK